MQKNKDKESGISTSATFKINKNLALPLIIAAKYEEYFNPEGNLTTKNQIIMEGIKDICKKIINDPNGFFLTLEIVYPNCVYQTKKGDKTSIEIPHENTLTSFQIFFTPEVKDLWIKAKRELKKVNKDINYRNLSYLVMYNFNKYQLPKYLKKIAEKYNINMEIKEVPNEEDEEIANIVEKMASLQKRLGEIKKNKNQY